MAGFEKGTHSHVNVKNGMGLQFSRQWTQEPPSEDEANNLRNNVSADPLLPQCYVRLERLSEEYIKAMTERCDYGSDLLQLVRVSPEPMRPTLGKSITRNIKRAGGILKCVHCPFRTKKKTYFSMHNKKINYSCPLCSFKANLKCVFSKHVASHSPTKVQEENTLEIQRSMARVPIYFCDFCRYFCKDGEQLLSHIKSHKSSIFNSTYFCSYCDFKTCSKPKLKDHYVYSHKMLFGNVRFAGDKINRSLGNVDPDTFPKIRGEARKADRPEIIRIKFEDSLVVMRISRVFVINQNTGPSGKTEIMIDLTEKRLDENRSADCDVIKDTSRLIEPMPEAKRLRRQGDAEPPSVATTPERGVAKGADVSSHADWFRCKYCSFRTPSKPTFVNHTVAVYFKCPKCLFSTTVRCNVFRHMKQHLEADLKCKLCKYTGRTRAALKAHVGLHDSNLETLVFMCGLCDYLCVRKEILLEHAEKAHSSVPDVAPALFCGYCKFETVCEESLTDHYVEAHNFVKQHALKSTSADNDRGSSEERASPKKRRVETRDGNVADAKPKKEAGVRCAYNCAQCDFSTADRLKFNKHKFVKHKRMLAKVYKCSKCSYDTVNHMAMQRHYTLKHNKKKGVSAETLECAICSFKCNDKALMEVHSTKHKNVDEVKIYSCDKCSFETIFKNHRMRHMRLHDAKTAKGAESNVFKCLKCDFQTDQQFMLISHNFTHILERCSNKANKAD